MGRQRAAPDVTSTAGFLASGIITPNAGDTINVNELVVNHEGGVVLRADPAWPSSALNNSSAGSDIPLFQQSLIPNISVSGRTASNCCGHPALIHNPFSLSGFCSSYSYAVPVQTSAGVGFVLRNSTGLQIGNYVQVSSDSCPTFHQITGIRSSAFTGFVVHWISGSTLKFAVYNYYGTQIVGATSISSSVSVAYQAPWWGACDNGDGTISFTYLTTGNAHTCVVYTCSTGSVSLAAFSLDTSVHAGFFGIIPSTVTPGDFILHSWDASAARFKCYRANNATGKLWGPVSPTSAGAFWTQPSTFNYHPSISRISEQPTGDLFHVFPNTSGYANVWRLTSGGSVPSLNAQIDFGTLYHDSGTAHPIVTTPNGFCVFHATNAGAGLTYASYYDLQGNPININVLVDSTGPSPASGSFVNCYGGLAGPYAATMRYFNDGNGNVEVRSIHVDLRGDPVCNPIIHQPKTNADCSAPVVRCNPDGSLFSMFFSVSNTQLYCTAHKIGRSAILGYATNSAAAGAPVTVQSYGAVTTPASQTFGPGFSWDSRDLPILGTRGNGGGNNFILGGWSL